jgi:NitT/TauT family transport system substrate-binding protein
LTRRQWLRRAALLAGAGFLAACAPASPAAAPTAPPAAKPTEVPKPAPTSIPAAAAKPTTPAATTTAPATKTAELTKVLILNGGQVMGWAPAYLALGNGFFRDEGLDVEYITSAQGAPSAVAAVVGGSAFMAFTGAPVATNAAKSGAPVRIALIASSEYGAELTASNTFLESRKVTAQLPLEQKIKALKSAKIGIDAPGDSNDQLVRVLLRQQSMDPDTEVELVALQSIPNKLAALQRGSIDIMIASPPSGLQAQQQAFGKIYIKPSEAPQLRGYPYLVGSLNVKDSQERPHIVKAVVKGMARAEHMLRTNPAAAKPIVAEHFKNFEPSVFDLAYETMLEAVPESPVPTRKSFDALENFVKLQGKTLDVSFEQAFAPTLAEEAVKELRL